MQKKLSEMSLEELWRLFPIFLVEHQFNWKQWYFEEKAILQHILTSIPVKRISHIGSTAVSNIWAKPIVDILVEVANDAAFTAIKKLLMNSGYLCMNQNNKRMSFNKGYTESGFAEKVFHIHIRVVGDNDELYFRDYLMEYPEVAKEYEKLKLALWKKYEYHRDGYTEGKTEFIAKLTLQAKTHYGNRYS